MIQQISHAGNIDKEGQMDIQDGRLHSYPSIYALGHRAIQGIFDTPVVVEEKVDGSQFSFGLIDGQLLCRSKGKQLILDAPEKMFAKAVETARSLQHRMREGYVYRCEYLNKPKHNTLAYDRTPDKCLVVFDIDTGGENYLSPAEKRHEAEMVGLECVPTLYEGIVADLSMFNGFMERVSFLGGAKVEGVVVKNYGMYTTDKRIAIAKYVSEAFKEVHGGEWRKNNPTRGDVVQAMIERYRTPARWAKAVQHLAEAGNLEGSPRDIGNLIKEVPADIRKECEEEIKDILFAHFWPQIQRASIAGLPEWYKQQLAQRAFE